LAGEEKLERYPSKRNYIIDIKGCIRYRCPGTDSFSALSSILYWQRVTAKVGWMLAARAFVKQLPGRQQLGKNPLQWILRRF
jgi:hypothetical protein